MKKYIHLILALAFTLGFLVIPVSATEQGGITQKGSEYWFEIGSYLLDNGEQSEAIYAFKNSLAFEPESAIVWLFLGTAYSMAEQYIDAISALERSVAIEPNNGLAWVAIGLSYDHIGITDKALDAFDKALTIDPGNPAYLLVRENLVATLDKQPTTEPTKGVVASAAFNNTEEVELT
jgi:tetratricopeptide (TPR) repeat protein